MPGFYIDPSYLLYMLPAFLIGLIAQLLLKLWTNQYMKKTPVSGLNGVQVVEKIANSKNFNISFSVSQRHLSDHYDPRNKNLALSKDIASVASITSVGIAAHELGHVEQDFSNSPLMKIRGLLVPAVGIGTNIGYGLLIMGIILGLANLAWLGIILFSASVVFSLITLPIELDASRRALRLLKDEQILLPNELGGAKKVLSAAALTYVAATVQSIATLLYFVGRTQGMNRN